MTISNPHHSFDIILAEEFSIEEAILIHHFQHWIRINRKLKRNFKENRWWTYQTREEIAAHFPYWNEDKVRRLTEKLVDRGVLIKGSEGFNKSSMDRTLWYAFVNEAKFLAFSNKVYDLANLPNGDDESANSIGESASSNHILKPDAKERSSSSSSILDSTQPSESDLSLKEGLRKKILCTDEEFKRAFEKYDKATYSIPRPAKWLEAVILEDRRVLKAKKDLEEESTRMPTEEELQESVKRVLEIADKVIEGNL